MPLDNLFLPAEKIAAIKSALKQTFNTTDITDASLLSGGLSGSSVYRIEFNDHLYTLKLNPIRDENTKTSRSLELASAAGIAPKLYYDDSLKGIAISDFIENQPIRNAFAPDKLIKELASTIKAIHAIPFDGKGSDLFETIDQLIAQFKKAGKFSGPIFDECFKQYNLLKSKYPLTEADIVFSHNDLNPNNILCDGERLWIVDWDVAYPNNRYIDLANVANFFIHTEDQERVFLSTYFGSEADEYQSAKFFAMRQICRIVYAMLMLQLATQAKPMDYPHSQEMDGIDMPTFGALMGAGKISLAEYEGQLMYAKALLNTAVMQMRTTRFQDSLAKF